MIGEGFRIDLVAGREPVVHRRHHAQLVKGILVQPGKDVVELGLGRHQVVPGDFAGFGRGRGLHLQQQGREQGQDEGRLLFDHDRVSVEGHKRTVIPSISA